MKRLSFASIKVAAGLLLLSFLQYEVTGESIAEVASGMDTLSTLVELVTAAGLVNSINGTSKVTVFAPTNNAFDDTLERRLLQNLLGNDAWSAHATQLVESHMIEGENLASAFTAPKNVTMVSGHVVAVTVDPVLAMDEAEVVEADVEADNGVIHVMDGVIAPAWLGQALPEAAADIDALSTLATLLEDADLVQELERRGPFTLFAPRDKAFDILGEYATECVTSSPAVLEATLMYHVLEGLVPASGVTTGDFSTMEGSDVSINATLLKLNNSSGIVTPDAALANNGIVHVIDTVLLPPSVAAAVDDCVELKLTITEKAARLGNFSTLVDLLDMVDYNETLGGEGPFNVFAPTDEAFEDLPAETIACVKSNDDIRDAIVSYHVLPENVTAEDIATGEVTTAEGSMLDVNITAMTINNTTNITEIEAVFGSNGVLHIIDAVLVPPTIVDELEACVSAAKAASDDAATSSVVARGYGFASLSAVLVLLSLVSALLSL